jgi:mRNA interferase RelE/StbE
VSSIAIKWERRAVKELASIPRDVQQHIVTAVEALRDHPLTGEQLAAEWKGMRRIRVGRYRVVYAFDGQKLLVLVVRVGHHGEVYRQR